MSSQPPDFARPYPPPPPPPPYPPRRRGSGAAVILILLLMGSLGLNFVLCCGLAGVNGAATGGESPIGLTEKHLAGNPSASDKVAVVRLEGTIMEGTLGYVHKQIEEAAKDNAVKAVVLRIDSPGGTITASDDLLRRFERLRDGTTLKYQGKTNKKPIVVSMGGVCASGGYYAAMAASPAQKDKPTLFAERTTITGSIGVYASLPNAKETADKIGFKMEMIRAGDIKGAGSPFHELTPQERQPWQDMVESAYGQFIEVVETGRPDLKGKLRDPLFPPRPIDKYDDKGNKVGPGGEYTRRRADGGIFTAKEALEIGLIDAIGTQHDAAVAAANLAGLTDYNVIQFDKPINLLAVLAGADAQAKMAAPVIPVVDFSPRLWYLLPQAEVGARVTAP